MSEPTRFLGTVEKVQTMADGAIRVTLDLPADSEAAAAVLMSYRRLQIAGSFTVEPGEEEEKGRNGEQPAGKSTKIHI